MKLPLPPCGHAAHQFLHSPVYRLAAAFALVANLVMTERCAAQFILASDSATNAAYANGWTNGVNGGSGFDPWSLSVPGANAGVFIGNPANNGMGTAGIGTTAFGLFSSAADSGYVNATRSFNSSLGVGDSLSFYWAMNFDGGPTGAKGFDIRSGGSTVFNVNNGGSQNISVGGVTVFTNYGTSPMLVTLLRTSSGFDFSMTSRSGGASYTTNVVTSSNITGFNLYEGNQSSAAGQRNIFFNNFTVTNSGVISTGGTVTNGFTFTGSGDLAVGNNTTLVLNGGGDNSFTGSTTISNGSTLNLAGAGNSGFVSAMSGSGSFAKSGSGTVTLSGNNSSYTGKTTISAGVLSIDSDARLGADPGLFVADQLTLSGGNSSGGSKLQTTADMTLLQNRGVTLAGGGGVFAVASGILTYDGVITGSGGLGKEGEGTLDLGGANTYSGATLMRGGTILVGSDQALGSGIFMFSFADATAKTLAASGSAARTITNSIQIYNNASLGQSSVNTGSLTFSGPVDLGNETNLVRTLLTADGTSHAFTGVVSGARGIIKQGGGTLALSGGNTFEGGLYVDNGVLDLAGGSLAEGIVEIGGGASGSGVNASNAVLRVSTDGTFGRAITVNAETNASGVSGLRIIEFANAGGTTAILSGNVSLEKNLTANVGTSSAVGELSGSIAGSGGLTKEGLGRLNLSANNSYTGPTTVAAGTLELSNGSIASSSVTVSSGASLSGYGSVGTLSGEGSIDPGNSPGIVTAEQINPSAGTDYNFELTGTVPTFNNAASSVNDLIRVTSPTPFSQSLAGGNAINIYFIGAALFTGNTGVQYKGGFFTDEPASFASSIGGATFNYFFANASGATSYNGVNFYTKSEYETVVLFGTNLTISVSTVAQTADFGSGDITGQIMQIDVIPEPTTYALLGLSALAFYISQWRCRRRGGS